VIALHINQLMALSVKNSVPWASWLSQVFPKAVSKTVTSNWLASMLWLKNSAIWALVSTRYAPCAGCTVTKARGTCAGSLTLTVRGCSAATVTLLASITRASMLKVPALPANCSSAEGESGYLFKLSLSFL